LQVALTLRPTLRAPGLTRERVAEFESALPQAALENVRLLLSELVTNAVKHAGLSRTEAIQVHVSSHSDGVEAMVRYPNHNKFDATISREPDGGWGLLIVDNVADHWSIVRTGDALEVWFEIETGR
jgi:two-component sensor histidine kinase